MIISIKKRTYSHVPLFDYTHHILILQFSHHKFSFTLLHVTVARIALVKPDKARGVEDVVLRAAQMGQIVDKVGSNVAHIFVKSFK